MNGSEREERRKQNHDFSISDGFSHFSHLATIFMRGKRKAETQGHKGNKETRTKVSFS